MTWRTGFTLTPGWSLLSLYKMNKILLVGPDPAWSEDAEPRRLSPSQSIPEGADENATCPHEPSTLFLPSHSAPLKPQMGASFSSDGALDAQFAAASQGLPALSTDPPSHPTVHQQLPESIQWGHSHFRGAEPAGGEGRPTAYISMATKHTLLPGAC